MQRQGILSLAKDEAYTSNIWFIVFFATSYTPWQFLYRI